jgi:hypothetical protein
MCWILLWFGLSIRKGAATRHGTLSAGKNPELPIKNAVPLFYSNLQSRFS